MLGVVDLIVSLLVYTAVLVYSPVLTFMCFYGATIGTVMGIKCFIRGFDKLI